MDDLHHTSIADWIEFKKAVIETIQVHDSRLSAQQERLVL